MATRQVAQAAVADDMVERSQKTLPIIEMDEMKLRLITGQLGKLTLDIKEKEAARNEINRDIKAMKEKQEVLAETLLNATTPIEVEEVLDWRHNTVTVIPQDGPFKEYTRTMTTEESQRSIPTGAPSRADVEDVPSGEE
jgi:hypothetical protein